MATAQLQTVYHYKSSSKKCVPPWPRAKDTPFSRVIRLRAPTQYLERIYCQEKKQQAPPIQPFYITCISKTSSGFTLKNSSRSLGPPAPTQRGLKAAAVKRAAGQHSACPTSRDRLVVPCQETWSLVFVGSK